MCLATALYIDSQIIKHYQQFILDIVSNDCSFCAIEEGTGKIIGAVIASINLPFDETMEDDDVNILYLMKMCLKYDKSSDDHSLLAPFE
jgi:hypothetical protein